MYDFEILAINKKIRQTKVEKKIKSSNWRENWERGPKINK